MDRIRAMVALLIIVAVFIFAGCGKDPIKTANTNNKEIKVEIMFEYDGCRMYRFDSGGRNIYYARCGSDVTTSWTETETQVHSNGKSTYTTTQEIPYSLQTTGNK